MDEEENEEFDNGDEVYDDANYEEMEDLKRILLEEKLKNPSQFVSHWEADESNVEETTEEERNKDVKKKFLWAAESGNINVLEELLAVDASLINCHDSDGYRPLHRAAYENRTDVVKFLLANGADINARTNDDWTALHSSCFWGQTDVVRILLQCKGCNVNAKTAGSQTALHLAAQNASSLDLFILLLMHPLIEPSVTNQLGEKPADIAKRSLPFHTIFEIAEPYLNIL